jgi:hypothetical protein
MKKIFYLPLFLLILLFSLKAEAAILYLAPETGTFQVGNTFSVSVKVNAQGTANQRWRRSN